MPSAKTNHPHWAKIEERGVYFGISSMFVIYRLFGHKIFSIFLYPVIGYFFIVHKQARQASQEFLARVHQHSGKKPPQWQDSFFHFMQFGEIILDKLSAWIGDIKPDQISYENRELVTKLIKEKTGSILIASHLGNIEACRAIGMIYKNLKINILVHTKHSDNFNRLMKESNPDSQISLIQITKINLATALLLQKKIEQGEFIIIMGDRVPANNSKHYSCVPFLGELAPFPQGPFILASLLKCPILLIFCLKEKKSYKLIFEHFIDETNLPSHQRQRALETLVAHYAARLEARCLEFPYQWFNFFNFWEQVRKSPPHKQKMLD